MDLEGDDKCTRDFLNIYDGPSESSLLGRVCQPTKSTFHALSNVMTIEFRTDGSVQNTGFEAFYNTSSTNSMSENCGGIFTDLHGELQSPWNTPSVSDYCVWHIVGSNNSKIHLDFVHFRMKDSDSCNSFTLSVYDGPPQTSPLLGQLCETNGRNFTSSSNSISFVYTNLRKGTDLGLEFIAAYYTVFQDNTNVILSCHSDSMEARVSLRYLNSLGLTTDDMHLRDPSCRPRILNDWLEFHIPYQSCQTQKQVTNDIISYTNSLITYSMEPRVIRKKKPNHTLICQMFQNTIVNSLYVPEDVSGTYLVQHGLYSANLTFFNSANFKHPVYDNPYVVELNENLYLQATLDTTDPNLVLFVHTCVASPIPFSWTRDVYKLVLNGCPKVPDYQSYASPSRSTVRFGFSAFSFLSYHPSVYIQCKLVVCDESDTQSRCKQGCNPRHKRAAEPHDEHLYAITGPIKLLNN
ncbi:CUB and zona pellucida-like domain-containing protein 1 [Eleutherodactylus coqui]|uniref:CUB and zona pellucida-like domain-containing protein 1 n=1 Tax=Eleutherodactylus coqui TaxID=57060 RepID=UPI003461FB7B